jgi:hypothetical protein
MLSIFPTGGMRTGINRPSGGIAPAGAAGRRKRDSFGAAMRSFDVSDLFLLK